LADRLKMVDLLSAGDTRQHLDFLTEPVGGNDQGYVLSHGLGRGIAEHSLGPGIPGRNEPLQSFADDGVVRGINNRCQQGARFFSGQIGLIHNFFF
jgi:hypothetical protein